jgi:hypothetical protein
MTQLLLALTCLLSADSLTGKVVKVTDGDTITVLVDNQQVKVRLNEIDAPENDPHRIKIGDEVLAIIKFNAKKGESPDSVLTRLLRSKRLKPEQQKKALETK